MRHLATVILTTCLMVSHTIEGSRLRNNGRNLQEIIATFGPTDSPIPSPSPSTSPTSFPTNSKMPSAPPTRSPGPTFLPSVVPTVLRSDGPTDSPVPSPSPSHLPSSMPSNIPSNLPTTNEIIMSGLLTVTLSGLTTLMNDESKSLLGFTVRQFIHDNAPPDTNVVVQPLSVNVTEQVLSPDDNQYLTTTFNVTALVMPRPLPPDFNYTYHIGYGFQNNSGLAAFLAAFTSAQQKKPSSTPGVGNIALVRDTVGDVDSSAEKWNKAAIGFLGMAVFAVLLLLLILCGRTCWRICCCCCHGKRNDNEDEDIILGDCHNEPSWDEPPAAEEGNRMKESAYTIPMANVHKCSSATCPTCSANQVEKMATFVPVTPSWDAFVSFSPRSNPFLSTKRSRG